MAISEGEAAPDFTLHDQVNGTHRLHNMRGRNVVLVFYPKAETPGCTRQACALRDHQADYAKRNAVVLGISPDTVEDVKAFDDNHGLNYTLLADPEREVIDAYGVWKEREVGGETYAGVERTTIIVDAEGTVAKVFPKISPTDHDELVLAALADLAGAPA